MEHPSDSITPPLSQMPNPTGRLYSHYDKNGKVSYSTEQPNTQTSIPEEKPIIKKKPRGWSKALQIFLFLLIVSALGLSYYSLNQISEIGEHVGQQVAIMPMSQHDNAPKTNPEIAEEQIVDAVDNTQLNAVQQIIEDLATKQQDLEQGLSTTRLKQDEAKDFMTSTLAFINVTKTQLESQNQLITTINQELQQTQKINTELQTAQDWTLNEIDYLLNLAQYQLRFMQDSKMALAILSTANKKLQQWSQPQLSKPLIAQIEQDIVTLQTTQILDMTLIYSQFSDYIKQIAQLTLVKAATTPVATASPQNIDKQPLEIFSMLESWGNVTSMVWNEVKQLVTVSHNKNVDAGLLTDSQAFFVQQSLGLKLESARLALLKSDFPTFQMILSEATLWLNQYYDQNSMQVLEMQIGLKELQKTDFSTHYPNMNKALDILHRTEIQWREHFLN
ncbi:MAG: uroporphyrinogen-III C-methyltransferase [Thiotrichaceae bacterium]|nr:uroporphyrinogen-III C-methyltransferase [Thiotrichaceae bacterium]